ncbi:M3 family metallopeptidase [Rhizosaccharibacter radicis]|uniref:M3 family metallopeptidase n=1 Tax=Rhizosaccharibacter radicis TaxID=2782605 RepID=A0ABT1VTU9_9PROT|nr:M3 family metallopeptidase [Acetobacteraceae bacterium KSS12]
MNRRILLRTVATVGAVFGGVAATETGWSARAADNANPLLSVSTLPFHAPRFDLIKDSDYAPAFEQGMAEQRAEIEHIANDPAAPTFDNTIVAMERSGRTLDRVQQAFSAVNGANTDDALDKVQADMAPKLAAHQDAIYLDPKLWARVEAIYGQRDALKLDPEQKQLLEVVHAQFLHAGAKLSDADKQKLRDLNTQLSTLETAFTQKLLAGTKAAALVVDDKTKLAGLDAAAIDAAQQAARDRKLDNKWVVTLQNTTQQPLLQPMTDRATRQALFEQSWTRTEKGDANDERGTVSQIAHLRAQKAALLGYPNYAAYVLFDQMAKTPEAVDRFLRGLVPATTAQEKREAADIQAMIRKDGQDFALKPWDWEHYAEQVRKQKYDLDEAQVRPYFELHRVLEDGVFFAAEKLYGLTFKKRTDIPTWNPDMMVYEVFDKDGSELGLAYFDYFKRDNKNGGAWMSNLVGQSKLLGTKPVIFNVANFTKPAPGQPALISFEDVTTMFHEFGHGLHGLFASQTYPTLSGTNVARDFVEFPSQFNEHWASDPTVFAHYARDYRTGAPMPAPLVAKLKKAAKFNQGYRLGELLASAMLDIDWHSLPATAAPQDVDRFEQDALNKTGLDVSDVPPRYRSSYFLHIWSNGYAAGYYAYLWTEMLDDDSFEWFQKHGGLTRANGQRFRDAILSRGHTEDYAPMFRAFYGRDPEIAPMLRNRGLAPSTN